MSASKLRFTFEKIVAVGGWLAFIHVLDLVMGHSH
jgi:hypothetical protein